MNRLPLTVIGGYLGAGKTTLINRLLAEDHGQRVLVMVNDFGAINIDAALIESQSDDMVELSNGCVCCTMGADLFMAVGDVLDRHPRPDHLVIEASGIADPARIAQVAMAEPDLSYGGVVTVVDAQNYDALASDIQIGAQLRGQVDVADLVLISKADAGQVPAALGVPEAQVLDLASLDVTAPLILGDALGSGPKAAAEVHPAYVSWNTREDRVLSRAQLDALIRNRPAKALRIKGFVASERGMTELHCVGPSHSLKPVPASKNTQTQLVGIGLKGHITRDDFQDWWASV
ncbi:CobW family GTP-binding protein [Ascidiaceihabitans sp.]|uniref:CobW family GTP-binding protein n=1 Tax=Ascidiaceihabitans sp. TaxID=1872644 RepID=UPI003299F687